MCLKLNVSVLKKLRALEFYTETYLELTLAGRKFGGFDEIFASILVRDQPTKLNSRKISNKVSVECT